MSETDTAPDDQLAEYCRDIETYLCRKNDGHLIRIVGPSFERVAGWARAGVPLKVAFGGIDRYFERYYRNGPRRRPVKIDFCEADVLDVFDEWRRATGVSAAEGGGRPSPTRRAPSLPEHLERALIRLTNLQATGTLGSGLDPLIQELSCELDRARAAAGGLRGEGRHQLIERLARADMALIGLGRAMFSQAEIASMRDEVVVLIGAAANQMAPDARDAAVNRGLDQLIRERLRLPTIRFS